MPVSDEMKEKRTFFQWINFIIPYIYTVGIVMIVVWMIASSILLGISVLKNDAMEIFL